MIQIDDSDHRLVFIDEVTRKLMQLRVADKLAGRYVELYDSPDLPLEVRWKDHLLPCLVFSEDQSIPHAVIVENQRLGHALAIVKAQQNLKHEINVWTNSEKTGYKLGRRAHCPEYKEKFLVIPAVEMTV